MKALAYEAQRLWDSGKTTPEICAILRCNSSWLAKNIDKSKGRPWLEKKHAAMREYKAQGHTGREVAEKFGVTEATVHRVCKGIAPQKANRVPSNKGVYQDEDTVARIVSERLYGFEYVGNYTGSDGSADLRCKRCGAVTTRSWVAIRHGNCRCSHCYHEDLQKQEETRAEAKAEQRRALAEERERIKAQREAEREAERLAKEQAKMHKCPVCGELTTRPKYCSDDCARKAINALHDHRRRIRISDAIVDTDISLKGLYNRDAGICWICGKECDYSDYTVVNGVFIAGNLYPSIDHVLPLSKGGEHSWDNIKLAHRICNTKKSDKVITPTCS